MPPELRFWWYATALSAFSGGFLGAMATVHQSSLQYTVEHAHAKPSTQQGWYIYHRRKNFVLLWQFLKQGGYYGGKFGAWMGLFFGVDVALDVVRRQRIEWWHGPVAGLTVTGLFNTVYGFWRQPALVKPSLMMGLGTGLAYSAVQYVDQYMRCGHGWQYETKYPRI